MRISATGQARTLLAPELAVCQLRLGFESGEMSDAVLRATELAREMALEFDRLRELQPSPISRTVLLPLATNRWRPYSSQGNQLPPRHSASSTARLTFTDFHALQTFIDTWSARPGVTVEHVDWQLTDETRNRKQASVLAGAVADAHERARMLAAAAGERGVSFVELADRRDDDGPAPRMFARSVDGSAAGSDGGFDVSPEEIEIIAHVAAVFSTD